MTMGAKVVVATLVGLLGVWATTSLGFWQLRRAAQKETLQRQVDDAASAVPQVPTASALRDPTALAYRHLRFQGEWLPDRVVYLENRPRLGQAGFYVLMPLRIRQPIEADLIVNRGWTPRNAVDRTAIEPYRTPTGTVTVTGVALAEEPRLLELARAGVRSLKGIWQNFDFDAYARASGQPALPVVLREDRPTNDAKASAGDGLERDWPDRGGALQSQIDRHHGYAFQWFALAATFAALLLYQVFRVIRHVRTIAPAIGDSAPTH